MPKSNRPHADEAVDGLELLGVDRLKLLAAFFTALMVLYSFFGNIYKVPMQLEQSVHKLEQLEKQHKDDSVELRRALDMLVATISADGLKINTLQVEIRHLQEAQQEVKRQLEEVSRQK